MNGGCLCGRVRYRTGDEFYDAVACHCERCRKASGAPYTVWVSFHTGQFDYIAALPAEFESSPGNYRSFCAQCGASLANRCGDRPDEIIVNVCTLDDPSAIPPEKHIWVTEAVPWVSIDDAIPRCKGPG